MDDLLTTDISLSTQDSPDYNVPHLIEIAALEVASGNIVFNLPN